MPEDRYVLDSPGHLGTHFDGQLVMMFMPDFGLG